MGALPKPKEKPILLIQPRVFSRSVLYSLVIRDGCFYFCKIGYSSWASAEEEYRFHSGMAESELLSAKDSLKVPVKSVTEIQIETKRDPWTASADNHGTVCFVSGKHALKFVLSSQTLAGLLTERLEANGCEFSVLDNAEPEGYRAPADREEDRRNAQTLTRIEGVLNSLTTLTAVWLLALPFAFPAGAAVCVLLPPVALLFSWRYRRFLQSRTRNSERLRPVLSVPILLPPMMLSVWVMIRLNVIYSALFFGMLLIFTILCVGLTLYCRPAYRSKAWAGILALFILSYSYSGVLVTNNMAGVRPVAQYTAIVEHKHTGHYRGGAIYYLDLSPWGDRHGGNYVSVGLQLYDEAKAGDMLSITQERGLWGVEWYQMSLAKPR